MNGIFGLLIHFILPIFIVKKEATAVYRRKKKRVGKTTLYEKS
jgi:hypothetical protein